MRRDSLRFPSCKLSSGPRHASQFSPSLSCGPLSLSYIAGFFFLISFLLPCPHLEAQETVLQLQTVPPLAQVRPFSKAVTMIVLVTRRDGTLIENGWIQLRLDAPRPGRFFSTDFPFVEGSQLLDIRLPIQQGKVQWQYLFAIRGQYQIETETVNANSKKSGKVFRFTVREHEKKWIFLGLLTLGLFLLGFFAGRLFTGAKLNGKANNALGFSLLLLGLIFWNGRTTAQENKTEKDLARLEIDAATVGRPARIRWSLIDSAVGKAGHLTLKIVHLEKGKTAFAVNKIPVVNEFSMEFQFTDGDEYRVEAIADINGGELSRSEKTVSVISIEPLPSAAISPIGFFLGVICVGLWAGRWSRRAAAPSRATFHIEG